MAPTSVMIGKWKAELGFNQGIPARAISRRNKEHISPNACLHSSPVQTFNQWEASKQKYSGEGVGPLHSIGPDNHREATEFIKHSRSEPARAPGKNIQLLFSSTNRSPSFPQSFSFFKYFYIGVFAVSYTLELEVSLWTLYTSIQ